MRLALVVLYFSLGCSLATEQEHTGELISGLSGFDEETQERVVSIANIASFEKLTTEIGVPSEAAQAIVEYRGGPDGVDGTEDDNLLSTYQELDAITFVGASALSKMAAYANNHDSSDILVGDRFVSRIAPFPTPLNAAQTAVVGASLDAFLYVPPEFRSFGYVDWRTKSVAEQALEKPPVLAPNGTTATFGRLSIIRPQHGNLHPSAAFIYRVAQHSEYTVIAWRNTEDPNQNGLRELESIDGVPVPAALYGRIYEIGSPEVNFIGFEQGSDQFLEHLQTLHKSWEAFEFDPLTTGFMLMGHGESSMEAMLTRNRLVEMGYPDAIRTLIAVDALGSFPDPEPLWVTIGREYAMPAIDRLGPAPDMWASLELFDTETWNKHFVGRDKDLIDLTVGSVLGPPVTVEPRLGYPPFALNNLNNIRPSHRLLAGALRSLDAPPNPLRLGELVDAFATLTSTSLIDLVTNGTILPGDYDSNGMLERKYMLGYGKQSLETSSPHDHAGIWEDPEVVDEILMKLAP